MSCGEGLWSRKVVCKSKGVKGVRGNNVIPDDSCRGNKPNITESCKKEECPPEDHFEWHLSPWGPVSMVACSWPFSKSEYSQLMPFHSYV